MSGFSRDVKLGLRTLLASPVSTAIMVLTLGLGIGWERARGRMRTLLLATAIVLALHTAALGLAFWAAESAIIGPERYGSPWQ